MGSAPSLSCTMQRTLTRRPRGPRRVVRIAEHNAAGLCGTRRETKRGGFRRRARALPPQGFCHIAMQHSKSVANAIPSVRRSG